MIAQYAEAHYEAVYTGICLEGFFYGFYSGIFAIYLYDHSSNKPESRTKTIIFYALCLLYALSTAVLVSDIAGSIVTLDITLLPPQLQIDLRPISLLFPILRDILTGCCNFTAHCITIYRCWIVWGQNTRVVIIPSFFAIAALATTLAQTGAIIIEPVEDLTTGWGVTMILTQFALIITVNTLVTSLIVFKILKVFLEAKVTSVERTLGSSGGTKLRHITFIMIESGMTLFAIQLVGTILYFSTDTAASNNSGSVIISGIAQMFNGITPTIILVRVSMRLSFDDKDSFREAVGSLRFNNPPSDSYTPRQIGSSSMPPQGQERNEQGAASGEIEEIARGP